MTLDDLIGLGIVVSFIYILYLKLIKKKNALDFMKGEEDSFDDDSGMFEGIK